MLLTLFSLFYIGEEMKVLGSIEYGVNILLILLSQDTNKYLQDPENTFYSQLVS